MLKSLLTHTLLLIILSVGQFSLAKAQCAGNCGEPTVGNCGCSTDCWLYGDCCPDIESACPDIRPTQPVYPPPFPGGGGSVTPLACNVNASICTPGVSPNFNFDQNTPGPPSDFANPTGCSTGLFGNPNGFGFIILNITGSGNLNLLVDGSSNTGFIDVVVYNIPPGVAPCTAVMSSANEIGCNYAPAAVGCTQFGNSFPGCTSIINPAPYVTAGQQLMVIVHDYSSSSSSFNLQLGTGSGLASTGPPNATINVPAPMCASAAPVQLTAVSNGGNWSGPGVSPTGMFNPAAAGPGTHTINYAVGQAPCNAASTAQITVLPNPTNPGFVTNSPVCLGQTITLTPNPGGPTGATYHWSGPGFNTVGPNPSRPNATLAMGGTYSMYMVSGGCTSSTATQMVTVNPTDPAPAIVTNAPVCHGMPVMLDGPATASSQYFWSGPNGFTGNTEDATLPVTDYSMTGTYSLYLVTNGCTSAVGTQWVEITVPPKPVIDAVQPLCFGSTPISLTVDRPGGTYTGTGITDGSYGVFDPVTAGSGIHEIIYTVPEPCGSADTVEIMVSYPLTISGTVTNETCPEVGDGAIQIDVVGAPGPFTYLWSNDATSEDLPNIILGPYTVTVTDQYGCSYDESFVVGAGSSINFSHTKQDVLCFGDPTGSILVTPLSGIPPYQYVVNGATYTSSPILNLYAGNYTVMLSDSKGCDTVFTTQISEPPALYADSTVHQIRLGDNLILTPTYGGGTGNIALDWVPPYNLSCFDCPNPMAWPNNPTNYRVYMTDENGCTATGHVQVSVYHDGPFIPNAFTPGNKDNLNNTWKISDYGVKTFEVTVFDRWGSKLYATDNIYEGWDGKMANGNLYEGGVYVYKTHITYIDGKEQTLTGHITLLR